MAYDEAHKKRMAKYRLAHRENLTLDLPKGTVARYRAHAESKGLTLTALIRQLIEADMAKPGE